LARKEAWVIKLAGWTSGAAGVVSKESCIENPVPSALVAKALK
jgi:hypothetical protein